MDSGLFCTRTITKETPSISDPNLLAQFGLQDLFRKKQRKKKSRPLPISFREVVLREKDVRIQDVNLLQKDSFLQK